MGEVVEFAQVLAASRRGRRSQKTLYFERRELQQLMALYSEFVMTGAWRDYAIDHQPGLAAFSIFRRTQERPVFVIAKRQVGPGAHEFLLFEEGRRRRRAGSLETVLDSLRKPLTVVS